MNISYIKLLKEQLYKNVTISFELYDIDSKNESLNDLPKQKILNKKILKVLLHF